MTALDAALLAYAGLYVRNLPRSATHAIPELRPLELKLCELLNYPDWYCDAWPGKPHIVTFFSWKDDKRGMDSRWSVDTKAGTVTAI